MGKLFNSLKTNIVNGFSNAHQQYAPHLFGEGGVLTGFKDSERVGKLKEGGEIIKENIGGPIKQAAAPVVEGFRKLPPVDFPGIPSIDNITDSKLLSDAKTIFSFGNSGMDLDEIKGMDFGAIMDGDYSSIDTSKFTPDISGTDALSYSNTDVSNISKYDIEGMTKGVDTDPERTLNLMTEGGMYNIDVDSMMEGTSISSIPGGNGILSKVSSIDVEGTIKDKLPVDIGLNIEDFGISTNDIGGVDVAGTLGVSAEDLKMDDETVAKGAESISSGKISFSFSFTDILHRVWGLMDDVNDFPDSSSIEDYGMGVRSTDDIGKYLNGVPSEFSSFDNYGKDTMSHYKGLEKTISTTEGELFSINAQKDLLGGLGGSLGDVGKALGDLGDVNADAQMELGKTLDEDINFNDIKLDQSMVKDYLNDASIANAENMDFMGSYFAEVGDFDYDLKAESALRTENLTELYSHPEGTPPLSARDAAKKELEQMLKDSPDMKLSSSEYESMLDDIEKSIRGY